MTTEYAISGLILAAISGAITYAIATKKGYAKGFFWLGFFFPLIGMIIAACLTDKTQSAPPAEPRIEFVKPNEYERDGQKIVMCGKCGEQYPRERAVTLKKCEDCGAYFDFS